MRRKIARALRKWADLIDPAVKPTAEDSRVTVRVECDSAEFMERIAEMKAALEELAEMMPRSAAL